MFSYRHAFHAGSHADILKHLTLIHLVEYLQEKPGALTIVDTHAGAGIYNLEDGFATVSNEADGGKKCSTATERVDGFDNLHVKVHRSYKRIRPQG